MNSDLCYALLNNQKLVNKICGRNTPFLTVNKQTVKAATKLYVKLCAAQFSCWQPVNTHPVKHALSRSVWHLRQPQYEFKWKPSKSLMIEKQSEFIWCWGMLRWSLDLDCCTSQIETPVWEAETHKAKCQFFSLLEVTFSLAVNETKQQRVIKADVFIQGFYRKLISWGMQSCAKLIGGSWHSCREAVASEGYRICIYIHGLLCVNHKTFNSNSSQHGFFSYSNIEKS